MRIKVGTEINCLFLKTESEANKEAGVLNYYAGGRRRKNENIHPYYEVFMV